MMVAEKNSITNKVDTAPLADRRITGSKTLADILAGSVSGPADLSAIEAVIIASDLLGDGTINALSASPAATTITPLELDNIAKATGAIGDAVGSTNMMGLSISQIAILQGALDTNVLHGPTIKSGYETPLRGLIDHASHGAGHARDSWTGARILEPQTAKPPAPPTLDQINSVSDIGARVKDARKAMGMTQQRFADLAGVGRRFLIELEHGKHSLEIGRVLAVCQAAGLMIGFAR